MMSAAVISAGVMSAAVISERAIDMMIGFEVSDRATYEAGMARPTWPGAPRPSAKFPRGRLGSDGCRTAGC